MTRVLWTSTQIGAYISKSERQILRYFEDGIIKVYREQGKYYEVETTQLDLLRPRTQNEIEEVKRLRADVDHLNIRFDDVEHRLDDLVANLTALEELASSQKRPAEIVAPTKRRERVTQESHVAPPDIPPGSTHAPEFAARHGVNAHTFRDQIRKGIRGERVRAIEREKPGRTGEHEYWLSPEQQAACLAFWERHGTPRTG